MNKLGVSSEHSEHVDYMWTKDGIMNIVKALKDWPFVAPGMVCSFALETLWMASLSDENYSLARAIIPRLRETVLENAGKENGKYIWEAVRDFTQGEVDKFR